MSRIVDHDDWFLDPAIFARIDAMWGPHTVDRFVSFHNAQLPGTAPRVQILSELLHEAEAQINLQKSEPPDIPRKSFMYVLHKLCMCNYIPDT